MRAGGHPRVQGDPPGVATHDLHDDDAAVGRGRREEPVDALGGEADGGVEPERRRGLVEVVVDRLRHADHPQPVAEQMMPDGERAVTADRDEGVDPGLVEATEQLVGAIDLDPRTVVLLDGVRRRVALVGRADDGAAEVRDPAHGLATELDESVAVVVVGKEQAVEAVADSDHVPPAVECRQRHRTDHRVQPRRIAAAGADRHTSNLFHPTRQYVTFRYGARCFIERSPGEPVRSVRSGSGPERTRFVRGRGRNEPNRLQPC